DRIVAVKDAKGDLEATSWVLRRTDLAYYSGDDKMTLPLLSVGAIGVVGVPTHLFGAETGSMIAAYLRGDVAGALAAHRQLLAVFTGFFRTQGVILAKAALALAGLPGGPVRPRWSTRPMSRSTSCAATSRMLGHPRELSERRHGR